MFLLRDFLRNPQPHYHDQRTRFSVMFLIFNTCESLGFLKKKKDSPPVNACNLLRLLLFNKNGTEDLIKKHFCKTCWRKLEIDRNRQSSLRARILLLHSITHPEGQRSSIRLRSSKLQKVKYCQRNEPHLAKAQPSKKMIRGTWLDASFSLNVQSDTRHLIGIWLDQLGNRRRNFLAPFLWLNLSTCTINLYR